MNDNDRIKPICLEQLFKNKNPKLATIIPGFIYRLLKRIICINQINDFISKYGDRKGLDFADGILEYLNVSFHVEGAENLPETGGRYIFVSNHPLGGPDGIILISFLGRKYPDLKFPVNDLLLNLKNLNNIFLAVNKHGRMAKKAAMDMEEAYASHNQIITFPYGMVSRKSHGIIKDLVWHKNFVTKAIQYRRDIIPIFISGTNSAFFYNLANLRKKLYIKANIEMLFLPKETFKKQGQSFTIKIGKPIPWQQLDNSKKPAEWAEEIKETVYKL